MANLITQNESESLHQPTKRDEATFWYLWLPHHAYLYRCCLGWMNHNPVHAEEALDYSMLKAHRKLPQYEHNLINVKGWLRQICYRTCLDLKRKMQKETALNELLADYHPTEHNCPIESATAQEMNEMVNKAIAALPTSLQQPLVLRVYQHQSYEQISQYLSISVCNARKRVQLGRQKVKQHLAREL